VTILAATGLQREEALIAADGVTAVVSGGRHDLLEQRLLAAADGATGVISVGIAGALEASLQPGDWVVATKVVAEDGEWPTDADWSAQLLKRLPAPSSGAICGVDAVLLKARDKRALCQRLGALAADMESHVAARVAKQLGLPFAAARVISDDAHHDLPPAVTVGMAPDGAMALGPVLWALAKNPLQLPALIRTGRDAEVAFRALKQLTIPLIPANAGTQAESPG
jgi:hopanoid-associated phosphorylase